MKKTNHTRMRSIGKKGNVKFQLMIIGIAAITLVVSFLITAFGVEISAEVDSQMSCISSLGNNATFTNTTAGEDCANKDVTGNLTDGLKTFAKFAGILSLLVIIVVVIKMLRQAAKK